MEIEKSTILNKKETELKKLWYKDINVYTNLFSFLAKKETFFKSKSFDEYCIRALNFMKLDFFEYTLKFYNFFERDYNIYISTAYYNFIPFFDLNLKNRSNQTNKWFLNMAEGNINDYDFLIDFDCKNKRDFNKMTKEIIFFLKLLNDNKVTFYIIPSGSNFQVVLKNFNTFKKEEIKDISLFLKENLDLIYSDLAGIGTAFKIMKCPFGFVGNIGCIPLNENEIKDFKNIAKNYKKYFNVKNILNKKLLNEKRGLINYISKEETQKNLRLFFKKYNCVW